MGGEGDAKPDAATQCRHPLPAADPAQVARAAHGVHRQRGRMAGPEAEGRGTQLFQGAGALLGLVPYCQKDIPRLQVSVHMALVAPDVVNIQMYSRSVA